LQDFNYRCIVVDAIADNVIIRVINAYYYQPMTLLMGLTFRITSNKKLSVKKITNTRIIFSIIEKYDAQSNNFD